MQIGDTVIFTVGNENQTQLGVIDDILFEVNLPSFSDSIWHVNRVKLNGIWHLPSKIRIIEKL
jgi:hypothetical protein